MDSAKFPGLEAVVFQMAVGQQTEGQFAGAGWIIRCVGKAPERVVPFEQVKAECREGALLAKGMAKNGKKIEEEFAAYRRSARLEALWPRYQRAVEAAGSG